MGAHGRLEKREWASGEVVGLEDADLVLGEFVARFGLELSVVRVVS